MDVLLLLLALIAVGVLAMVFGHDSRETIDSTEQRLARLGMVWEGKPTSVAGLTVHPTRPMRRPARARLVPLRQHVARALFALADWLSPGPTTRPAER